MLIFLLCHRFFTLSVPSVTFCAAKLHKKNDIRKRECHFYGFWVANQGFWRDLVQERNDLFCQFFDALFAVIDKNEAPLGPPMEGGR